MKKPILLSDIINEQEKNIIHRSQSLSEPRTFQTARPEFRSYDIDSEREPSSRKKGNEKRGSSVDKSPKTREATDNNYINVLISDKPEDVMKIIKHFSLEEVTSICENNFIYIATIKDEKNIKKLKFVTDNKNNVEKFYCIKPKKFNHKQKGIKQKVNTFDIDGKQIDYEKAYILWQYVHAKGGWAPYVINKSFSNVDKHIDNYINSFNSTKVDNEKISIVVTRNAKEVSEIVKFLPFNEIEELCKENYFYILTIKNDDAIEKIKNRVKKSFDYRTIISFREKVVGKKLRDYIDKVSTFDINGDKLDYDSAIEVWRYAREKGGISPLRIDTAIYRYKYV